MPKQIVTFKFSMDQRVRIIHLNLWGTITNMNVSDAGNSYYVETPDKNTWQVERYLEEEK